MPRESRIETRRSHVKHDADGLKTRVVRELERRQAEAIASDGFHPRNRRRQWRRRIANKQGFRKPATLEIPRASPILAPLPPAEFSRALAEVHHELSEELR
jgi:hypothetical protein